METDSTLKKNDIIPLEITALTNEGSGVGRHEGMAVFVPFTAAGDIISCRVVKVLKSYAYGIIEKIVKPSPDRIENDCAAFRKCGGCAFRHISYEAELKAKEGFVKDAFLRIGGLSPEFLPIYGVEPDGYRNKLQMPFSKAENGDIVCGFFSQRSHRVIPVEKCRLQPEIFSDITQVVCNTAKRLKISVYNEEKHEGVLRHIYLRKGHYSGEICLCLVVKRSVPQLSVLAGEVMEKFPQIKGAVLNINPNRTNVILGEKEIVLRGDPVIHDEMCGVPVEISPKSFYQVNTPAAEALYRKAREFAAPDNAVILDLYCGAGTIGLSMAQSARCIIGAEIVPDAVENARKTAAKAGLNNAEFICADAGEAAKTLSDRGISPDVIILDPPRKGCDEFTLNACIGLSPERIVMVSCDPASAARDCAFLRKAGYGAIRAGAFDLFPRTVHVETVVLMSRVKD